MNTLEVLEATRSLLANPKRWCKLDYCQDAQGRRAPYWDSRACKFSLTGALMRVGYITHSRFDEAYHLLHRCIDKQRITTVERFNDAQGTSYSLIWDVLNRAIVLAGGAYQKMEGEDDE